jgi:class 3 adenylate cyclase
MAVIPRPQQRAPAFARSSERRRGKACARSLRTSCGRPPARHRGPSRSCFGDNGSAHGAMGVHTGEAAIAQDDYIGLDVHRAARICSAGHGGQALISSSTRELIAGELPADVALTDLGEHRLKDLDRPEHSFKPRDVRSQRTPRRRSLATSGSARALLRWAGSSRVRSDDARASSLGSKSSPGRTEPRLRQRSRLRIGPTG